MEKDGSFLATTSHYTDGNNTPGGGTRACTIKISSAGKILWQYNYSLKCNELAGATATIKTKDGGYFTGVTINQVSVTTYGAVIMKQDSSGNALWARFIGDTTLIEGPADMAYDSSDGTYIVLIEEDNINNVTLNWTKLVKIDSNANVLKVRDYPNTATDLHIINTYDGNFLISGYENNGNGSTAYHLWKVNSDLEQDSFDMSANFTYDYLCASGMHKSDTISIKNSPIFNIDTIHQETIEDSNQNVYDSIPCDLKLTGIKEIDPPSNSKISVYPNPSDNTFSIELEGGSFQQSQVNLYDILGHSIASFSTSKNEFTINASDYSMKSGIYILTIRSGNAVLNAKLVME